MKQEELCFGLEQYDEFPRVAVIKYAGMTGVAIQIMSNLSDKWQAEDIIVFWDNGDYTALPEDNIELIRYGIGSK